MTELLNGPGAGWAAALAAGPLTGPMEPWDRWHERRLRESFTEWAGREYPDLPATGREPMLAAYRAGYDKRSGEED
jgi:hypothetical protein